MREKGIVRRTDELGRVSFPKIFAEHLESGRETRYIKHLQLNESGGYMKVG